MAKRLPLTKQTTVDDLIRGAGELRALQEVENEPHMAASFGRVADFLEREIYRREKRSMPEPLGLTPPNRESD